MWSIASPYEYINIKVLAIGVPAIIERLIRRVFESGKESGMLRGNVQIARSD